MIAVVPVQDGVLPVGAEEAIAECGGRCVLIGSGVVAALNELTGVASAVTLAEVGDYRPIAWSGALVDLLAPESIVVVPGSADGRGFAPHLATKLGVALVVGAVKIKPTLAVISDGELEQDARLQRAVVVMTPGVRSVESGALEPTVTTVNLSVSTEADATLVQLLPADPATIDLATASRIVAGGAGLKDVGNLELLRSTGLMFGASLGATRVLTDAGWLEHARQIGTTGVEIDPDLYIAVGISGAVQHLMGIGNPSHVIAVNTDASCPMMHRADLALVTDGPGFVAEFATAIANEPKADQV